MLPIVTACAPGIREMHGGCQEDIDRQEDEAQIVDIHKMIEECKTGRAREIVADMDKSVREMVKSRMGVWENEFQIDLPADAREGLLLRMSRIVNDAVDAMAEHQVGSGPPLGVS
jgi:hypothetical protein